MVRARSRAIGCREHRTGDGRRSRFRGLIGADSAKCMQRLNSDWPIQLLRLAFWTRAFPSQEFPGINTAAVPVVPVKVDCILAHWRDFKRSRGFLIHGQSAWFGLWRLANLASARLALLVASRARTGIAQPSEREVTLVRVFPLDVHALTSGFFHFDGSWISRLSWENTCLFGLNAPHFLGLTGLNWIVRHAQSMTPGTGKRPSGCNR